MKPFSDLFPYILPYAPSAPDPVVEQYARQATIDFCKRTRSWRDVQDIDVTGEESEIVCAPQFASIYEIEVANFKVPTAEKWMTLRRVPYREMDQTLLDDAPTDRSVPNVISQASFNTVIIAPHAMGTLRISAYLMPSVDAEYGPDYIFDNFSSEIADGALSHILMIPDQPYTNPNLGALKAGLFNQACDANFAINIRGQQRAPARTKASFM